MQELDLLIVDDEPLVAEALKTVLPSHWKIQSRTRLDATELSHYRSVHAALVDMHFANGQFLSPQSSTASGGPLHHSVQTLGPTYIRKLRDRFPQAEIIAISGNASVELMQEALDAGATRFLEKPLSIKSILRILEKVESLWALRNKTTSANGAFIGTTEAADSVLRRIAELRGENGPILIEGETGTGKELVFELLNQQEPGRVAVRVHVAAIPDSLFEAELFGHVKGAFTGADQSRPGLAEAASGGDLFLDEIEALPLHNQVKLLRFLESGEVRRVGSRETIRVNCRVIMASNQDLSQLVKEQKFREDLYHRIQSNRVSLPPLRDRKQDLPALCAHFLTDPRGESKTKQISTEAMSALATYAWPGNIRELKRVCEQLRLVAPLPVLRKVDVMRLIAPAPSEMSTNQQTSSVHQKNFDLARGLEALLLQTEREILSQGISNTSDVDKLAQILGVSRSSLYKKLKDHGL